MKVGFVFTNYNNSLLSKAAVESIKTANTENIKIVIVDNASSVENCKILHAIEKCHKNVHVIYNKKNVGYFPGLNVGIDHIREHWPDYRYLVVGNNDLIFSADFLTNLAHRQSLLLKYPVVSPNIVDLNGNHQNPHVIKGISKLRWLVYDLYYSHYVLAQIISKLARLTKPISARKDVTSYLDPQEIYLGFGACYILGPLFFEHFNKLWAPTFLMHEEFFLSKQLNNKNFNIYYEPSICIKHLSSATIGKLPGRQLWLYASQSYKELKKYI